MENLFFLVVLLIIIVVNVINLKKRTKGEPDGKSPAGNPASGEHSGAGGSWKTSVEKFFEQIKDEFEASSDGPSGRVRRSPDYKPDDEDLFSGQAEPARREEGVPKQMETRQEKWSPGLRRGGENIRAPLMEADGETLMERRAREAPPSSRAGAARDDVQKPVKDEIYTDQRNDLRDDLKTKPAADLSVFRKGGYSVAQLQKAVVWSEVLGAPVALRKGQGESWER